MAQMNKVDVSQRLDMLDAEGKWIYPSAAESGHIEIELPTLPGSPNPVERLHARDFGVHVAGKIEGQMQRQPYLKSGPQQNPGQVLRHYAAVAAGSGLLDRAALKQIEGLAAGFEAEPSRRHFEQVVRPWLHGLTPGRKQS